MDFSGTRWHDFKAVNRQTVRQEKASDRKNKMRTKYQGPKATCLNQ